MVENSDGTEDLAEHRFFGLTLLELEAQPCSSPPDAGRPKKIWYQPFTR